MNGFIDANNRALIEIHVSNKLSGQATPIVAWIETAFDGHLVFSSELIKRLELEALVETDANLADGSRVLLETY